ncbi:MAG: tetratricopeptide repeat protein [Rhodopseudomonas palustris]|nr:tetratricopeptide repeat protein [Rhodopseudomonas palustris]
MVNRPFPILAALFAAALFSSCASKPPVIPEDASAMELIQRAQEASDRSDWAAAIVFYETARERFGSDPSVLVTCEYETAFIHYKQGRYALAEEEFTALIAKYESPEGSSLPPRYLILARKVLPTVREKMGKPADATGTSSTN